jgi:ferredoxin
MTKFQLQKFIKWLQGERYSIIGPVKDGRRILIQEIKDPKELDLSGRLPEYSFKKYFIPEEEVLFEYRGQNKNGIASGLSLQKERLPRNDRRRQTIIGMSVFDLKALHLYNHVFEKDPYYQARMRDILIIGQFRMPSPRSWAFQIWQEQYEENVLEHLQFDIFLGQQRRGTRTGFKIYTGSEEGQAILEKFGYRNYEHIQFAGPIKEEGIEKRFLRIKEKIKIDDSKRFWKDLASKCIECGKCSIVCPTCFCFDMSDRCDFEKINRDRCWSSCFYNEFSKVAGGHKFLPDTQSRIYNWYYHKFVRVLDEYGFPSCVGCGRCTTVCPTGIEIQKVLAAIVRTRSSVSSRTSGCRTTR